MNFIIVVIIDIVNVIIIVFILGTGGTSIYSSIRSGRFKPTLSTWDLFPRFFTICWKIQLCS